MSTPERRSILLFDPYLSTLGGGERYLFSLASALDAIGDVTIGSSAIPTVDQLAHLGFHTRWPLRALPSDAFTAVSAEYDMTVVLANYLPPPSLASDSWAIVQFPFESVPPWSMVRTRFHHWRTYRRYRYVVYSPFCQEWLRRRWRVSSSILAPAVEQGTYIEAEKEPVVLGVGRFFVGGHAKRHDLLIDAFKRLPKTSPWKLILAGGAKDDEATRAYIEGLRDRIGDADIQLRINIGHAELDSVYRRASLFWHATGFGRDATHPEQAEHFGMTTVEAMSYGAVPLVFADGGQSEIVRPEAGCQWNTLDELVDSSARLMSDDARRRILAMAATAAARQYAPDRFAKRAREIFGALPRNH